MFPEISGPHEPDTDGAFHDVSAPAIQNGTYAITHQQDEMDVDEMGSYEVSLPVDESSIDDVTPNLEGHIPLR